MQSDNIHPALRGLIACAGQLESVIGASAPPPLEALSDDDIQFLKDMNIGGDDER
jgi:hypothetical protein